MPHAFSLLIVLVAAAAADLSWYFAGTRHGNKVLRLLCKMSLSTDSCVHHTEAAFERIGPRALLVTKYLPRIGPVAVALAGAVAMRLGLFIILDMGGALLYFGPPILLGHFFHGALGPILEWMATLGLYGLIIFAGLVAIWLFLHHRKRMARMNVTPMLTSRKELSYRDHNIGG